MKFNPCPVLKCWVAKANSGAIQHSVGPPFGLRGYQKNFLSALRARLGNLIVVGSLPDLFFTWKGREPEVRIPFHD